MKVNKMETNKTSCWEIIKMQSKENEVRFFTQISKSESLYLKTHSTPTTLTYVTTHYFAFSDQFYACYFPDRSKQKHTWRLLSVIYLPELSWQPFLLLRNALLLRISFLLYTEIIPSRIAANNCVLWNSIAISFNQPRWTKLNISLVNEWQAYCKVTSPFECPLFSRLHKERCGVYSGDRPTGNGDLAQRETFALKIGGGPRDLAKRQSSFESRYFLTNTGHPVTAGP